MNSVSQIRSSYKHKLCDWSTLSHPRSYLSADTESDSDGEMTVSYQRDIIRFFSSGCKRHLPSKTNSALDSQCLLPSKFNKTFWDCADSQWFSSLGVFIGTNCKVEFVVRCDGLWWQLSSCCERKMNSRKLRTKQSMLFLSQDQASAQKLITIRLKGKL